MREKERLGGDGGARGEARRQRGRDGGKLSGGAHVGRALALARRLWRARGSEQGVERGMERACWCPSSSAAGRRARGQRWDARQRRRRMAATYRARVVRWGVFANSWRATTGSAWDAILGYFQAESGPGPNTKIEARTKLYVFH